MIRHHDVTGKLCPNPYIYNTTRHTWERFKADIAKLPASGWVHDVHGWWYRDPDGSYLRMCWRLINHHWYCFGACGYILTGWIQRDGHKTGAGKWYFLEESVDFQGACWHEISCGRGALERWYEA